MQAESAVDIHIRTIQMLPPSAGTTRRALIKNELSDKLVEHEAFLRKKAYRNTTIKTDDSFFDDSDMTSEYSLVVVYDQSSDTALLSSRYYFNKPVIAKYLKGDSNSDAILTHKGEPFSLDAYKDGTIFLADRLSGNIHSPLYRAYRSRIFQMFYSEMVNSNKDCTLLLMVRKAKGDKQLSRYLRNGFVIIGSVQHKGKEHSIILKDFNTSSDQC
jgi:hypothetical protein